MSERCANCGHGVDRANDHRALAGDGRLPPRALHIGPWTCTAHDWRAEAMRLRDVLHVAAVYVRDSYAPDADYDRMRFDRLHGALVKLGFKLPPIMTLSDHNAEHIKPGNDLIGLECYWTTGCANAECVYHDAEPPMRALASRADDGGHDNGSR